MRAVYKAGMLVIGLFAAASAGQTCTPTLVGFPTGPTPYSRSATPYVYASIIAHDGDEGPSLVVSGQFVIPPILETSGAVDYVARYRNGKWTPMRGTGVTGSLVEMDFSSVGGPVRSIYGYGPRGDVNRWTGTGWAYIGIAGNNDVGGTLAAFHDDQGPVLLASKVDSTIVYAWRGSGTTWTRYHPIGPYGTIRKLSVVNDGTGDVIYAVGNFATANNTLRGVVKSNGGPWQQVPLPDTTSFLEFSDIVAFDDGTNGLELYLSGIFDLPGTSPCNIARLRNGVWEAVGGGLPAWSTGPGPSLFTVEEPDGTHLYACVFGGVREWTGAGWRTPFFLPNGSASLRNMYTVASFDDGAGPATYFGGSMVGMSATAGEQSVDSLAAFGLGRIKNGVLESVGRGIGFYPGNSSNDPQGIRMLAADLGNGPELCFAGGISRAGGPRARRAGRFDGTTWTPMSIVNTVGLLRGLASVTRGGATRLYSTGGLPIFYSEGSEWIAVSQPRPAGFGSAGVLTGIGDRLYAGTSSGLYSFDGDAWAVEWSGGPVSSIAAWSEGGQPRVYVGANGPSGPGVYAVRDGILLRVGEGLAISPSVLYVHDDGDGATLYAGAANLPGGIRRYNGSSWEGLGTGLVMTGTSLALASFDDGSGPALYAAGDIFSAGGRSTPGLCRWRNGAWSTVTPWVLNGTGPYTLGGASLAVVRDRLYIGGAFVNIGGIQADGLAYIEACPRACAQDYDGDGDTGTDADIEAFFRCLSGDCCARCPADFDGDGNGGTDGDIEAFFRVLAGGNC